MKPIRSESTTSRKTIATGPAGVETAYGRYSAAASVGMPRTLRSKRNPNVAPRMPSSEMAQPSPASAMSASASGLTDCSDGHMPWGAWPKWRVKASMPRRIWVLASSGWRKRVSGKGRCGRATRAASRSHRSGRIGW
ncbi:hypothetical protein D3C72_1647860 [compost metagenome]